MGESPRSRSEMKRKVPEIDRKTKFAMQWVKSLFRSELRRISEVAEGIEQNSEIELAPK